MADPTTKNGANESKPAFTPQDLTDLDNPIRAKFISLICIATYGELDEEGASTFVEKCLELCGGSKELFSQVLQTRFMEKRTPLFLVLCHTRKLSGSATTIPPLITHLLEHLELSGSVLDDMELACCVQEHKQLYQLIRRSYLQCSDTITTGSYPQGGRYECPIKIPQFIDKMMISQKIHAPFIAWWTIFDWTFSVTPDDNWIARLEIKTFHPWKQFKRPGAFELNIHKVRLYDNEGHDKWVTDCKKIDTKVRDFRTDGLKIDFLREWDNFLDKRRTLAMTVVLTDWKWH